MSEEESLKAKEVTHYWKDIKNQEDVWLTRELKLSKYLLSIFIC